MKGPIGVTIGIQFPHSLHQALRVAIIISNSNNSKKNIRNKNSNSSNT